MTKLNIMWFDDDPSSINEHLEYLCKKSKFKVHYTDSISEAVKSSLLDAMDLVILDLVINGEEGQGFDLLNVIKDNRRDLPSITLTNTQEIQEKAIKKGVDMVLRKPFDPKDLEDIITNLAIKQELKRKYYSCFISYSSKDNEFAQKIYADLQSNGVRCWFAPHDMKIGDEIRTSIEKALLRRDKVLLILSKNSIGSVWVKDEVEAAFEAEKRKNNIILFPIQIDDSMHKTKQAWASKLRRQRHVGNFTNWTDRNEYKRVFDTLLKDLIVQRDVSQ